MHKLLRLSRLIDRGIEQLGRLTYWLVLAMVAIGAWNAVGRHLGRAISVNLTTNTLVEAQWYLFDLVFLFGAAYALKHDEHVRVDVFYKGWPPRRKAIANLIGISLFLIPFCLLSIYFSWNWTFNSWKIFEMSSDPGGLPRYPIKTAVILSFILLIIQGISEAIKQVALLRGAIAQPQEDHHGGL
ncbi:MAG: TRAP transporter small permease subunit [Cyanophyceae cyanobacterium]